jgi:malate synthase
VITWARAFLDDVIPLADGSYGDVAQFRVEQDPGVLTAELVGGGRTGLRRPEAFAGYRGSRSEPSSVLLENNGLAIELVIDRSHPVGAGDAAGIADVILESAVTTIVDLEDSVATVDGGDKVAAYRNWLGLMRGDLVENVTKDGHTTLRRLAADRIYTGPGRLQAGQARPGPAARP